MEAILWLSGAVGSALIGVVLSLIFNDPLKQAMFGLLSKVSLRQDEGIAGTWQATFYFPENGANTPYVEAIELQERFGMVTGWIIPHPDNHARIRQSQSKRPVRVRGSLKDNNYFTGIWLHPNRRAHYHGSFQLIIYPSGDEMKGYWIGFSRSKNEVLSGRWEWTRLDERRESVGRLPVET